MVVDISPESSAQVPIVMVADASQIKKSTAVIRTVGVCEPMANLPDDPYFGRAPLDFMAAAVNYLFEYEKLNFSDREARVTILQPPTHGEITALVKGTASYIPERTFYGQDKIVALVEIAGYQVKVVYFIKIQPKGSGGVPTDDAEVIKRLCGPKGSVWKISATPATQYVANLRGLFGVNGNQVSLSFADMPGASVGQTTGTFITLDTTAGGYGWFIDPTPTDSEEFLSIADPKVWLAKLDSAADGNK